MWIERLRLRAFGPFTACDVALGPGLNILFGANEAGKSSALRAIRALLFGINARSPDDFVHPYNQLRLGAVLVRGDGQRLEFTRRKGNKQTLRDADDDRPLDEGALRAFLGQVDEELFSSMFGIDHAVLRQGGAEVVRGGGRVGELLFAAGGVGDLRARQQQLEADLADLFKPSGQKPTINQLLARHRDLRDEVKRLQTPPETWIRLEAEHQRLVRRREELDAELRRRQAEAGRLQRIEDALPSLTQWRSETAELAALGDVPLLDESFALRRQDAMQRCHVAADRGRRAESVIAELEAQQAALDVPTELLADSAAIEALQERLGSHRKAATDRQRLVADMERATASALAIFHQIGRFHDLTALERLPRDLHVRVQGLARRHAALRERADAARRQVAQLARRAAQAEEALNALPPARDVSALRATLEAAFADAGLETTLAESLARREQLVDQADRMLAALPRFSGDLATLVALPVPDLATIEHYDEATRAAAHEVERAARQLRELEQQHVRLTRDWAERQAGETPPSHDELAAIRALRDRGWALVRGAWQGTAPPPAALAAFLAEAGGGTDLAEAFARVMHRADAVADRLRQEADRVAAVAQLAAQVAAAERSIELAREELSACRQRQADVDAQWHARWREIGVEPLPPRDMRGWRQQWTNLCQLHDGLAQLKSALAELERRRAERLAELTAVASLWSSAPQSAEASLSTRLAETQRLVETLERQEQDRRQAAREVERARSELVDAETALRDADAEFGQWRADWTAAMQPLQLPADALPEQAESVLAGLAEWREHRRMADDLPARLTGIDRDAADFERDVIALTARLAPDLDAADAEHAVVELRRRAAAALQLQQQRLAAEQQLATQQKAAEQAAAEVRQAQAELAALCQTAGCADPDELPAVETRASRKRTLQASVDGLSRQLHALSGGRDIETFAAEADAETPDLLPQQRADLAAEIRRLQLERDATLQAEQSARDELRRIDGGSQAAEKAAEAELALAELTRHVRDFAVLKTSATLLHASIQRYREHAQGPIVARASAAFAALTNGSFCALRTDFNDDGQPVLLGVRPNGGPALPVSAMSEGACDQLYLALRIATLEHWLQQHEPVPFIVDDVLLSFDDQRAAAALREFAQLAERTQILFFTHHQHLVELARDVLGANDDARRLQIRCEWTMSG
jgi:uncharacterized protein YhaN